MPTSHMQENHRDYFSKPTLRITGLFHPLGEGRFFIRLTQTPRNSQGLASQLVRLPSGWVRITLEIQPVQDDWLQPLVENSIEVLDETLARQMAVIEGQEEHFLLINIISFSIDF